MESLRFNKYQYAVGAMDVANPVSGLFGAVKVGNMLEQRGTDVILEKEFALATVNGRRRRSCSQGLSNCGELGAEWTLQLLWMTSIETPCSLLLTDHE